MQNILGFKDINWGKDEAKGDPDLLRYFVSFPGMDDIEQGKIRYIIGRKGTGKTAVFEYLRQKSSGDPLSFYRSISLRDFPLGLMRQLEDKRLADKSKYVPVWRYLLLMELCAMIGENNSLLDADIKRDIDQFIKDNFSDKICSVNSLTVLKERGLKLSIASNGLGIELLGKKSETISGDIHYQKICEVLETKIKQLRGGFRYYIFLDELDEGYRAGDSSIRLILLALLRAVEDMAITFSGTDIKVFPMIGLRSDIWNGLNDNDLNKYNDYLIRLRWESSEENGQMSLRRVVNCRIAASLGIPESDKDWWPQFAQDSDVNIPDRKPLWKHLIIKTHDRPRDILKFLKICAKKTTPQRLLYKDAEKSERDFSDWLYDELKNEAGAHVPVWQEVLDCISRFGRIYIDNSAELVAEFQRDGKVSDWMNQSKTSGEALLEILFNFGVIGMRNKNDFYVFRFKNEDARYDARNTVVVQFGLIKKLSLRG